MRLGHAAGFFFAEELVPHGGHHPVTEISERARDEAKWRDHKTRIARDFHDSKDRCRMRENLAVVVENNRLEVFGQPLGKQFAGRLPLKWGVFNRVRLVVR